MQLSRIYQGMGEETFRRVLGAVSMGSLRTYRLFDQVKARAHLGKLNQETLRKAAPRLWARLGEGEEELAKDLGQAVLVSHLDLIRAVLDFLGVAHRDGFFDKTGDAASKLTEGWQQRAWEEFRGRFPEPVLLFYVNHLAWELTKEPALFLPAQTSG